MGIEQTTMRALADSDLRDCEPVPVEHRDTGEPGIAWPGRTGMALVEWADTGNVSVLAVESLWLIEGADGSE